MDDLYEYSIPDLVKMIGTRFKDYRLRSDMTQKDVAEQSGVTITTIHKFENGAAGNISLAVLFRLLKAIEEIECINQILPELPESACLIKNGNKIQRIRHKKHQ
jgi:transcriptional regulator with XRE-family HTH domain